MTPAPHPKLTENDLVRLWLSPVFGRCAVTARDLSYESAMHSTPYSVYLALCDAAQEHMIPMKDHTVNIPALRDVIWLGQAI